MRKLHLLIIGSGVLLLALLIYTVGPGSLWHQFTALGWALLPLILLEGAANLFHTQGWRHCLSGPHRSLPFLKVFSFFIAGGSINYLTPFANVGGEVAKGVLLASDRGGTEAATGVILDKLAFALGQLIFIVAGAVSLHSYVDVPVSLWIPLVIGTVLLGCGMVGFLLVQQYGKLGAVVRWAARHRLGAALERSAGHMARVDRELQCFYRSRPHDLLLSVLWHFLGNVWSIVPAFYFLVLLTDNASPVMASAIVLFGTWFDLVTFAIPHDIGVQEAGRVGVFRVLDFPLALGLTYGITRRLQQLFWAGTGLVIYAVILIRRRKVRAAEERRGVVMEHHCN